MSLWIDVILGVTQMSEVWITKVCCLKPAEGELETREYCSSLCLQGVLGESVWVICGECKTQKLTP